ncbi:MAG TPA: LLM class flavin-dependent oxidoreductase [Sporichthyaceae bacterium]
MRLSVRVRYAEPAALEPLLLAAEDLGYDGFWLSEPWGVDAFAVLGWCAARTRRITLGSHVASVFARTPAATAAAAATVQSLSGGRFRLGLGTSGPGVVEGWHGVPFEQPVERTRDTVAVLRAVLSGDKVTHAGTTLSVPLGEHRPLRTALPDDVAPVPVYLGALGPRNQRLTADVADGWTPTPYSPDFDVALAAPLRDRLAGNGRTVAVAPTCPVAVGADLNALWDLERGWTALYLGGMGEFYANTARVMEQATMVESVRQRWAAGDRRAAKAAVSDDYADAVGLFGSAARIRKRAERYAAAGVDELVIELRKPDLADQLADLRAVREALT